MIGGGWDWAFWVGGGVLAAAGVVVLAWALFWDRARGRRRCPGCWYDMAGVPGLVCPECGREARGEQRLRRTRRRWRGVGAGTVALIAAYGTWRVPTWRVNGWTALVPSPLLVFVAPTGARPTLRQYLAQATSRPGPAPTIAEALTDAVWDRLITGRLASWESQAYLSRFLAAERIDVAECLIVPDRWPIDQQTSVLLTNVPRLPLTLRAGSEGQGTIDTSATTRFRVGPPTGGMLRVDLALCRGERAVYKRSLAVPIRTRPSLTDLLDRVETADANAVARDAINPRLRRTRGGDLVVLVSDRSGSKEWRAVNFILAYHVEVRIGERVVGTAEGSAWWRSVMERIWRPLPIRWSEGGWAAASEPGADLRLAFRGDPIMAAKLFMMDPFETPTQRCWSGEFVVEVNEIAEEPRP